VRNNKVQQQWETARHKWRIRAVHSGKWFRERGQKGLSAIPHLFTLLNLTFGVFSIMMTIQGNFRAAALSVAGSLIADGLDGRLARLLKADGEFGKELDSLADVVAFGTAPAILLYQMELQQFGVYGMIIAFIFPMCGALRLAQFNIIKTSGFFMGVPITAAGTLVSCLAFYLMQESTPWVSPYFLAMSMLLLAYLMISTVPYPDFKKRKQKDKAVNVVPAVGPLLVILAVLISSRWNPWSVVVIPLAAYVTLGPWLLLLKQWSEKVQPRLTGTGRH
jgi:CDP-diacylglycerol---serine O-phosphatidyltransferase